MDEELVSTDTILNWLSGQVKHKIPIAPERYLDAIMKLNLLKSEDNDQLIELKHELAVKRANYVNEGGTSAAANILLEADETFKLVKKLEAKMKMIEETIRIGKIAARLKNDELNNSRFGQI